MKKNLIISISIVVSFFFILEIGSRIAYAIYAHTPSYLMYGFNNVFNRHPQKIDSGGRDAFRIACFGGSTTAGWYSRENNYPYCLQLYLQKRFPEKQIIVENFGIPSATPVEAAYLLRASIDMDIKPVIWGGLKKDQIERLCGPERYDKIPDLVILYSHVNATFIENLRLKKVLNEEEYAKIKYITPKIALKGRSGFAETFFIMNNYLKAKSFFYYSLGRMIFWMRHDRYIIPKDKIPEGNGPFLSVLKMQEKISRYQKNVKTSNFEDTISTAVYMAKRSKIPIIIGTEPIAMEKYNDKVNEDFAVIHEINANVLRKICYENKVDLLDVMEVFRETPGSNEFFGPDLIHLTTEGDKFLGEKFGEFIIDKGYIK